MERRCALCGRKLYSNSSILGLTCLKKMCLQVGITDVKNLSGINLLSDKILVLSNKESLPAKQTSYLADRYLALSLLNEVNIDGYDNYRELIQTDINSINKTTKLSELESFNTITLKQAAEINKQYKKYENIINKLMNGEYDAFQEITVELIKFAFSSYYGKKDYLSDELQKLQYFIFMCGVSMLKIIQKNFSADCLEHSLLENPTDIEITENDIIEKIKNSNEFKESISNLLNEHLNESEFTTLEKTKSITFSSDWDLLLSVHTMDLNVSAQKQSNNKWNLDITLSDIYDFTELKLLEDYISNEEYVENFILCFANNFALISSSCKVITPYKITIKFTIENWEE